MRRMKASKVRDMNRTELEQKLYELKGELFNLRFQMATGQLENPIKVRDVRKSIAVVKTVMRENELKSADLK